MADGFAATYAKAIEDLSGKIFIPGLIASIFVEFGPWYKFVRNADFLETYVVCVIAGGLLSAIFFYLLFLGSIYLYNGRDIAPIVATIIMPLGFAGLFPAQFEGITVPYSQVTGVAILAWAFMLLSKGSWGMFENY